ncbi:hypothetical protein Q428_05485 [Fervidicella metallireducens AeB]|uniref:DUF218 domain-containing protein n=1 Tax=Fervidicella metallireducens AeB TaxID=1403537 RepID=A0A017RW43_9CLOT|nr:YdcF family protein [Fervidicella metallireducens]EYE88836.1 hypothetical protein Q428_05485 [Fervidicella metallireducens AeB]
MRNVYKVVLIILIFSVIPVFLLINILSFALTVKPQKSDCVIVLGCRVYGTVPSPFLKCRVDEGYRMLKEGYGKYIIVSGGKGKGEDISEALAMKNYLISKGVKEDRIIVEDKSTSTYENLFNSKRIMNEKGFNSAVIVSNSFHLKRSSLIAEKVGINGSYSGVFVREHVFDEVKSFLREMLALIKFYVLG